MRPRTLKAALTATAMMLVAALSLGTILRPSSQQSTPTEPPADLIKSIVPGNVAKGVYQDLVRSWYDWDTMDQSVTVKRRERQTSATQWYEQIQDMSASYYPVDVRCLCTTAGQISEVFIAGIYPTGESCIERWVFTYPVVGGAAYVPISQRKLPTVRRLELFRGTQYGRIRGVEPDPDGRFVLFLTRETPTVYRKPLPSGTIVTELTSATAPYLSNVTQMVVRQHATEGRQYHLLTGTRWEVDLSGPNDFVVLRDGNNDGVFDAPVTLTPQDWTSLGWDSPTAWVRICP